MPTLFPTKAAGDTLSATDWNDAFDLVESSLLGSGPYVITGLVPSVGTGLSVNVTAGTALGGALVTTTSFVIGSLAPSTTNHLYLLLNTGAGTSNPTGTAPANSVKLGTALTGASTVTSVDTSSTSGRQTKVALNVFLKDADQTLAEGTDIAVGTSTGTKLATATTQKLAFWNATPVVQPAANVDTSGATLGQLETEVNELKALLRSVGLMAP